MTSPVTQCRLRGEYNPELGYFAWHDMITATTTPQAFDEECAKYPTLKLNNTGSMGYFSLAIAAETGNISLINHIAFKDPTLLNIGTDRGMTSLFCAVANNQREAARLLTHLSSDVNTASNKFVDMGYDGGMQAGTTPLAFVLQKVYRFSFAEQRKNYGRETLHPYNIQIVQNIAMAKLLLLNGAVAEPPVNEEGTKVLQQAKKEIDEMQSSLIREIFNAPGIVSVAMPRALVEITASYVPLDEIPETVPELPDPLWPEDPYRSEFPDLPTAATE